MIWIILLLLAGQNTYAYALMVRDKGLARRNEWRIPESRLLMMAVMFGSIGIFVGMMPPLRHKIRNPKFFFGVPILLLLQLFLVYKYVW